ncbi:MAG: ABC transporter permease [Actinobacteria bacterium]|nr:ABC transporter permease [Actinomycetota bacterium]
MSASLTLAWRDFVTTRSYRAALVFDLVWGVVDLLLYFFISKIVNLAGADLHGAPSYFAFAVAGVLGSLIVGSATAEIASRIREEQLTGTLELLTAQPIHTAELALGTAVFPLLYAVVRVALYFAIAVVALDLPTAHTDLLGATVLLLLSAFAFLPLGIAAAAVTVVLKRGSAIVDAGVFAMTFVSGALFPLSVLPGWLRAIGRVMPTKPAFDGLRHALFGGGGWGGDALILLTIGCIGAPLSVALLDAGLRHARRTGTLAQY